VRSKERKLEAMRSWGDLFKGKKITLMGLGLLGRGVGDAVFLAKSGAQLTVTDLKNEKALAKSIRPLKKFNNVKFVLGEHHLEDFRADTADMVIKAAGVPLSSPFIDEAYKNNVPILMSTALFAKLTPARIIGVTGTRGKSTVTDMIFEILKLANKKNENSEVFVGGNVRGLSTLALLPSVGFKDSVVLELDSWQLQGFAGVHQKEFRIKDKNGEDLKGFSPHVSVFTTFMPDHLNYYDGSLKRYFIDKAHIYRFQNKTDSLIVSEEVAHFIKKFGPKPKAKIVVVRYRDLPSSWKLKIPGEHNRLNAALAVATVRALSVSGGGMSGMLEKIPEKIIRRAIESYKGLPGRLEFIRKYKGIDIYNDTNSTTPEATIVALKALSRSGRAGHTARKDNRPKIVLIFGGADKKLDSGSLLKVLPKYVKAVIVLPGSGTEIIKHTLDKFSLKYRSKLPITFVKNMKEAVRGAVKNSRKGDYLLMSPAFASFGLFKNEYDRGDQFNAVVKKLH